MTYSELIKLQLTINMADTRDDIRSAKPEKFSGLNFKRWQKQMRFWLTTLGLISVLEYQNTSKETSTSTPQTETLAPTSSTPTKPTKDQDYLCLNRILSALSDTLYDIYCEFDSAKELWEALETEYGFDDVGAHRFSASSFYNFKMVNDKPIGDQLHTFQDHVRYLESKGSKFSEEFKVSNLIDKLPPSWSDFARELRHNQSSLTLNNAIVKVRIENEHRQNEKSKTEVSPKVNLTEESKNPNRHKSSFKPKNRNFKNSGNKFHNKGPSKYSQNQNQNSYKSNGGSKNNQKHCYVCGRTNHLAPQCFYKKTQPVQASNRFKAAPKHQVNMIEGTPNNSFRLENSIPLINNTIYNSNDWWLDSGANIHVCNERSWFLNYQESSGGNVILGNDSVAQVSGRGRINLEFTSGKILVLNNVLHVPTIRRNLISSSILLSVGYRIVMDSNKVVISKNNVFIGKGYVCEGLIKLNVSPNLINNEISPIVLNTENSSLWHERLGHVNYGTIQRMINKGLLPNHNIKERTKCEKCAQCKHTRKAFSNIARDSSLLELIHSDVCDSGKVLTRGGRRYFVTFIDDYSKYCYVYLLKTKDEVLGNFKIYKAEVEKQTEKSIKILRSDRGGEYMDNDFTQFCQEHGIIHEVTAPYTPQSNGVAERKNRTLLDMINCMLVSSGAPENLWGEALLTACYVLNRIPNKTSNITPYEYWKNRSLKLDYFKVWGCLAKVGIPEPKKRKIGSKTVDAIFIGYTQGTTNRFLVIHSDNPDVSPNTIIEARDATYFEDIFPYKTRMPKQLASSSSSSMSNNPSTSTSLEEPRRSKRGRIEKDYGDDFLVYSVEGEPSTYSEAMSSPDAPFWKEAIDSEMKSLLENNSWHLTDLPKGFKTVGCRWVFKKKLRPDGSVDKYKARLVAKGFTQKKGIDYFNTYSPVASITTIRTLLALASIYKLHIHQMDVKTAFLNGDLEEEIYMEQPEGFIVKGKENKVCRLVKSIYGLKQASKDWFKKFDCVITKYGFVSNEFDKCLYYKVIGDEYVIICIYVDDILIFSRSMACIVDIKNYLSKNFDMKDLGEANVILGMRIFRSEKGIHMSLSHSIEKMLKKYNYMDCRPVSTPYDSSVALNKNKGNPISQHKYSQIIGSLLYISNRTRPDISYAVGRLSRYTSNPSQEHWTALERVLKYLKGTIDYSLIYSGHPDLLEGYSDANWVTDSRQVKSTSGFIFLFGGGAISWGSVKQTIIARSTSDAELIALDTTCLEAEWLRNLLLDLSFLFKIVPPVHVHCDSTAVLDLLAQETVNAKLNRHLQIRYKSIKRLMRDYVTLDFVRSEENLSDPLTKGLSRKKILDSSRGMGLSP